MPLTSFAYFGRYTIGLILSLAAALAMALPSPKDIEAAVSAGHLVQAETLLREVLQEKPGSAKAHYELGQVLARQARYADAQAALTQAQTLDPALKFAASPEKFNELFNKVSHQAKGLTGNAVASGLSEPHPAATRTAPSTPEPGFPLHYVWIGIAGLVVLALVLRRPKTAVPTYAAPMPASHSGNAPAYGPGYGPGYAPQYPAGQPMGGMGSGTGSGMGGAVLGGLAGVAAGYALSKALEGEHHTPAPNTSVASDPGYVPFDNPTAPDLGSFDAGSGNGWDDAPGNVGSDDSW